MSWDGGISIWGYAGLTALVLWLLIMAIKMSRCALGLHRWEYVQTTLRVPGGLFRICQRCSRPDYHEGTML